MNFGDRFEAKIERTAGCWLWRGQLTSYGYGLIWSGAAGRKLRAHRVAYEMWVSEIPEGWHVHHECGNKACVNPAHLRALPADEHLMLGDTRAAVNARKEKCQNGHTFDSKNRRQRACKTCRREYMRAWRSRKAVV